MARWLCLLLLAGCASELTELIVVIDSDLAVPDSSDAVHLRVDGPTATAVDDSVVLARRDQLPLTLGLSPAGGRLGPVTVTATAHKSGSVVVRRTLRTQFVRGHRRTLVLRLLGRCSRVECAEGASCDESGGCVPIDVDPATLPPWTGTPMPLPVLDAAVPLPDATDDASPADGAIEPDSGSDAGPSGCAPGTCDVETNEGCDAGMSCDVNAAVELFCRPVSTGTDGTPCVDGTTCGLGLGCINVNGSAACRRLCCEGNDAICPMGQRCIIRPSSTPFLQACYPVGCDIFTSAGCSETESCYPFDMEGTTFCLVPTGSGMQGASCTASRGNSCARGHVCVPPGICAQLCRVAGGEPACGPGLRCAPVYAGASVGFCST